MRHDPPPLGWLGILRLGLVQTALGAVVVLTTSAINRVMVVELALPAALPGALVGLHYAVQVLRPRMGHGSDVGGRRAPWVLGGMGGAGARGAGAAGGRGLDRLDHDDRGLRRDHRGGGAAARPLLAGAAAGGLGRRLRRGLPARAARRLGRGAARRGLLPPG